MGGQENIKKREKDQDKIHNSDFDMHYCRCSGSGYDMAVG